MRTRRPASLAFLTASITLLAAAASAPASPWSPPGVFPNSDSGYPILAGNASGPRAVYWSSYNPGPPTPGNVSTFVSLLGPGLQPGPAQTVRPPLAFDALDGGLDLGAVYGTASLVFSGSSTDVETGPLIGPFKSHLFPARVRGVDADPAGDIAAVIEPCGNSACHTTAPELVFARRGQAFGKPIRLDRKGHGSNASVAINPAGRMLAVWDRDGNVYARFISTDGRLAPIQRVGTETAPSTFHVVVPDNTHAAIGWTSQRVNEGYAHTPFVATVSIERANGHFGRGRVLDTVDRIGNGRWIPYQGLVIRMPAGQSGLAAWTGYDGTDYIVREATIDGAVVGPPRTVSQPGVDTVLADAAEGPDGAATILMLPGRAGENAVKNQGGLVAVARASPAEPFGPIEGVEAGHNYVDGAAAGIDTAGDVFATWRDVNTDAIGWSVRTPTG
jgi:hypothetical protein